MKVVIIASYGESLINFRGALLASMVKAGHSVLVCAPEIDDELVLRLKKMGVNSHPIKLQRNGMNPLADLYSVFELIKVIKSSHPDRVFSYTIKPVIYASLAARYARIPREHTYSMITGLGYSFETQTFKKRLVNMVVKKLYKLALDKTRVVFFQNTDDQKMFLNQGLIRPPTLTVVVNGSGVDLSYYNECPPVCGPVVFLLIARLLKTKGIAEYVNAAKAIKSRYPNTRFRLVGPLDTNPEAISLKQIEQWQSSGYVEYGGAVRDVRPEIEKASVYVLPSYREGTPRTVLEAMAMGRPIITTDAPGCRETVQAGVNGFLVPVKDSIALAIAMERFISNPAIIPEMGRQSRAIAVDKYDVNKVNETLLKSMEFHEN